MSLNWNDLTTMEPWSAILRQPAWSNFIAPCELTIGAGSQSRFSATSVSWSTIDCQNFVSRSTKVELGFCISLSFK
jgi:hypothetical protein